MCEQGVRRLIEQAGGLLGRPDCGWERVHDGFGTIAPPRAKYAPRLLAHECLAGCGETIPIVRRPLISCEYNLPDAAIYQALRHGAPCVAIGEVVADITNTRAGPGKGNEWQGLLWDLYQVAFVWADCGAVADFRPHSKSQCPDCACRLEEIAKDLQPELDGARREGLIPARGPKYIEKATGERLRPVLSRAFQKHGYRLEGQRSIPAPYWPHKGPDIPYRRQGVHGIAVELKVDMDWDHPLGQEVADLLEYCAVLHIRVPRGSSHGASDAQAEIDQAQNVLRETGRARFICVSPSDSPLVHVAPLGPCTA